jgi:tetratricopeptide (TPR) repeat protein
VTARVNRFWLDILQGNWAEARRLSEEGLALQPHDGRNLGSRALLECQLGDFSQADAYLERLLGARRLSVPALPFEHAMVAASIPLAGRIRGSTDRFDEAHASVGAIRSNRPVLPLVDLYATVGEALVAVGTNAALAEELYAALEPLRGRVLLLFASMTTDRLLGLLALTMGRLDQALVHLEQALSFCGRAGYRPEYAWTACDVADALRTRAGSADEEKAVSFEDESLAIATELGIHPLIERVLRRREILKA